MQHWSIFQLNTVLSPSIIVQHAESTVYSLHWHLSDIHTVEFILLLELKHYSSMQP